MNWFDILIIVITIIALIKGFSSGLIMQIASLAGIVIGAIFAGQLSEYIEPYIEKISWIGSSYAAPVSYIVAFLVIFIILMLIGKVIHAFVKAIQLNLINRLAGSIFCTVKWFFIISLILNLAKAMDKEHWIMKKDTFDKSQTYPLLKELAPKAIPYLRFEKVTSYLP